MFAQLVATLSFLSISVAFDPFSAHVPFDIKKVSEKAESIPSHSWEYGTAFETLLELYNPEYSVYGEKPFPVPTLDTLDIKALAYADANIVIGTGKDALSDGDGAVGDPASLGVAAYMLGKSNGTYKNAAYEQLRYVVYEAPRWTNGAISHRSEVPELWADFVYMAPPFIAYYGAATNNHFLLEEAYDQVMKYREVLSSRNNGSGLWEHIIGPLTADPGHWSTGNAWAVAGMARVLATIQKAPSAGFLFRQKATRDITNSIKEIVDAVLTADPDPTNDLVRNYVDDYTSPHGFGEFSGTSMIASVIYRMAVLEPGTFARRRYIAWANSVFVKLGGEDEDGINYVTPEGIVRQTVNPLGWQDIEPFHTGSPEGQAMVTLAYSAYRDFKTSGGNIMQEL